jgi:hypothetical protein
MAGKSHLSGDEMPKSKSETASKCDGAQDPVSLYEKAGELADEGRLEEAISTYKAGLDLIQAAEPRETNRIAYFAIKVGKLLWQTGRYKEAQPYFKMSGKDVPPIPITTQPTGKALAILKRQGLASELTNKMMKEICEEIGADPEEDDIMVSVLASYYDHDSNGLSERAIKDGFLHHDWRFGQETDDVFAEICQIIGKPIFRQLGYETIEGKNFAKVETENGIESFEIFNGLHDIIAFTNAKLKSLGDERSFISMDTQGDWFAYYFLDPARAKAIFGGKRPVLRRGD